MDSHEKKTLLVDTRLSDEPEIGRWLWALQDVRRRTIGELDGLSPAAVDWLPGDNDNTIGTVLYHIANIEADWLYVEVLEEPFPPEVSALFPYVTRDEQGQLTQVEGITLEEHLGRLQRVRDLLLGAYRKMDRAEFRRLRSLPQYDVTPEWVLHHLMQHEAEHRSQIGALRARAQRHLVGR